MTKSIQNVPSRTPFADYDGIRRKLIARGLSGESTELPQGYKALFVPRKHNEPNFAYLFNDRIEVADPLICFADDVEFAAWVTDLRKAVLAHRDSVVGFWRKRIVVIGQADVRRHTRGSVKDMVHAEIDTLLQLHVFTASHAADLKRRLTTRKISRYVLEGFTIAEMIAGQRRQA